MRRGSGSVVFGSVAALILVALLLGSGAASAATYKTLHAFTGPDGLDPYFDNVLVFDHAGNLFGTTLGGGAYNWGTVYRLSPRPDGTWVQTVLYNFSGGPDGGQPVAGVVFDVAGNLYGTTSRGGVHDRSTEHARKSQSAERLRRETNRKRRKPRVTD